MLLLKNKNNILLSCLLFIIFIMGPAFVSLHTVGAQEQASPPAQSQKLTADTDCEGASPDSSNCGIIRYLVIFINVLSVMAGIVIAGSIAYGGIQYSMSAADPQKVSAAKERIRNAIIALVFFIFGYAILNYLIPGGLL